MQYCSRYFGGYRRVSERTFGSGDGEKKIFALRRNCYTLQLPVTLEGMVLTFSLSFEDYTHKKKAGI